MVDVPPRATRVAAESWLTNVQRGMPESDGNPITESDKFFMALVMIKSHANLIAENDKLVTQQPRAKREAKGSWSMCHLERSALLKNHGLPTYSGEALSLRTFA